MASIITVGLLIDLFAYGLLRVFDRGGRAIWLASPSLAQQARSRTCPGLQRGTGRAPQHRRFLHNTCAIIAVIGLITAMLLVARLST